MNQYSKILLRFSAIFALVGAFLGSHMAGAGSMAFRPIHAHILVVGWLTLFAWAVYYKVFYKKTSKLAATQVATGIIGAIGLTVGMWLQYLQPFNINDVFSLIFYIVGGSILLVSFVLFMLLTFTQQNEQNE